MSLKSIIKKVSTATSKGVAAVAKVAATPLGGAALGLIPGLGGAIAAGAKVADKALTATSKAAAAVAANKPDLSAAINPAQMQKTVSANIVASEQQKAAAKELEAKAAAAAKEAGKKTSIAKEGEAKATAEASAKSSRVMWIVGGIVSAVAFVWYLVKRKKRR